MVEDSSISETTVFSLFIIVLHITTHAVIIHTNFWAKKSFQTDNVAPAGGGVLTLIIVLNGICEDFGATFAVLLGILLGADDDGFRAVALVDAVDYFVKSFHLADLLSGDIEEVLLDGAVGTDTHHNDTSPLILHTLNENTIQHLGSCLHNGNR